MTATDKAKLRVAFVVGTFPLVSETFIINQVADMLDRDVHVEVFAFGRGSAENVSSRYDAYRMGRRTHCLQPPGSRLQRLAGALPIAFRLFCASPLLLIRVLTRGIQVRSLRLLFEVAPFVGKRFDVIHCHFGTCAVAFLSIKDVLKLNTPFVTTFYGYDVSSVVKQLPNCYDRLKHESSLFFVMSNDMRRRVVSQGFPDSKVKVHPVSIDVESYPFCERTLPSSELIELVSVGRFVEKKGFDDLLRALAIVRRSSNRAFRCSVIGGGALEGQIRDLTSALRLQDLVDFRGYLGIEEIIRLLLTKHIMVQPSKIAKDGDME